MSFSGLKTSVRYFLESDAGKDARREDVAASFQAAVIDVLIDRVARALDADDYRALVLSGGVAANGALQSAFPALGAQRGIPSFVPERRFCTDNAAMIAAAAERRADVARVDPRTLVADPNLAVRSEWSAAMIVRVLFGLVAFGSSRRSAACAAAHGVVRRTSADDHRALGLHRLGEPALPHRDRARRRRRPRDVHVVARRRAQQPRRHSVVQPGTWISLEDDIEVRFDGEAFAAGDFWTFPARSCRRHGHAEGAAARSKAQRSWSRQAPSMNR